MSSPESWLPSGSLEIYLRTDNLARDESEMRKLEREAVREKKENEERFYRAMRDIYMLRCGMTLLLFKNMTGLGSQAGESGRGRVGSD